MGNVKEGTKAVLGIWGILTIVLVTVAVIGGAVWGFGVLTSDLKGQGDATRQINSGTNRIGQYEHFFQLDANIRTQAKLSAAAQKDLDTFNKQFPPSSTEGFQITEQRGNLTRNVTGPRQLCVDNVNKYNNESKEYTKSKFVDSRLPWDFNTDACSDPAQLPSAPTN